MSLVVDVEVAGRGVRLDVSVADGESVAIVGPNGVGKSTLLLVAAGLLEFTSGRVLIDDQVVATPHRSLAPHRRQVAYLPQEASLLPPLDAASNVAFGPRMRGASPAEARERAQEMLAAVGAEQLATRKPSQLSGGQAQRVALARALATDPRVLLIDEPLAAVDADSRDGLRALIARHAVGRSCLIVSHDEADVTALTSRVVRL